MKKDCLKKYWKLASKIINNHYGGCDIDNYSFCCSRLMKSNLADI